MKTYHLNPIGDGWQLTLEGREKPLAVFSCKWVALTAARDLADQRSGRLFVFRGDGTIEEERNPAVPQENL